jgi:translation initiation factor IF-2
MTTKKSSSSTPDKKKPATDKKKPAKAAADKKKMKKPEVEEIDRRAHLARGPIVMPPPRPVVVPAPAPAVPVAAVAVPEKKADPVKQAVVKEEPAKQDTAKLPEKSAQPKKNSAPPAATPPKIAPRVPPKPFHSDRPKMPHGPDVKKAPAKKAPVPVAKKSNQSNAVVKTVLESSGRAKIRYNEMMTVKDLAEAMNIKVTEVIKKLLVQGTPASINQRVSEDVATLLADAFNFDIDMKSIFVDEVVDPKEDAANLKPRSPVVTVMGHVDHGKTSLLDAIRSARVAAGEAGGITQHIGAYQVKTEKGVITFLDTPGHEAFTAMRARGANATDLVVLVVAADDSVMPQTIEALDHARAANVPIIVAINKVDLPQANVQKVKQELAQHNLLSEDWGGKTVMVEVSAKTRHNIDKLLEMILLETELLELKANPNRSAKGVVLEAKMDPRRGVTSTVLIQAGTLRVGDVIVCGLSQGRVRAMLDDLWKPVEAAGPATPVAILGLSAVPQVGDQLSVVGSDREAREIIEKRKGLLADQSAHRAGHLSLESLHSQIEEGKLQELKVIVKADVQGSLQAIKDSLGKIATTTIQVRFVHSAVGNINESDILLAEAADAIVFGFNVKIEASAEAEAKRALVDVRTYQIIYEMLADVKAAMEGLLKPEEREVVKGRAVVKTVFNSSRFGSIAGCMVNEGKLTRGQKARVVRHGEVVAKGPLTSLKRFKDDVKEVEKGYECGLAVEGYRQYEPGDVIEVFIIEKHARRLESQA